jgi:hypothetical protein
MAPDEPTPLSHLVPEPPEDPGEGALAEMFAGVRRVTVDAPRTPRSRLQELPTRIRVPLAVLAAVLGGALVTGGMGIRDDLGTVALSLALSSVQVCVVVALAATMALRAASHAMSGVVPVVSWFLLGMPAAYAVAPFWQGDDLAVAASTHLACALGASLTAVVGAAALAVLDRSERPATWRVAAMAAGGGAVGLLAMNSHCSAVSWEHLLLGHAPGGLVAWVVGGTVAAVWRPRGDRSPA